MQQRETRHAETPPRTWRRPPTIQIRVNSAGNTSTYVEKTVYGHTLTPLIRKHLHVRGEDLDMLRDKQFVSETPPRTWRRRTKYTCGIGGLRNTSTYVEKTYLQIPGALLKWKHLHVRGEDFHVMTAMTVALETPPRTWRRLNPANQLQYNGRNTSTYVEKTP